MALERLLRATTDSFMLPLAAAIADAS